MQSKLKLSDVDHIFKLSDFPSKTENDAPELDAELAKEDTSTSDEAINEQKVAPILPKSRTFPVRDFDTPSNPIPPNETVFGWLKVVGSVSQNSTSKDWTSSGDHETLDAPPAVAEARWMAKRGKDGGEEDFGAERRLARRLAARFDDEPADAPPQGLASALAPYIVAAGLFIVVVGTSAYLFAPRGQAKQSVNVGVARVESKPPASQEATEGRIPGAVPGSETRRPGADVASRKSVVRKTSVTLTGTSANAATIPAMGSPRPDERGWIPRQADKQGDTDQKPVEASQNPSVKAENWSDTVETFKQLLNAKPKPQDGSSQRYLEALDAWQNAKKAP